MSKRGARLRIQLADEPSSPPTSAPSRLRQRPQGNVVVDPLKPSPSLLVKLGSIAVHAEELLSPKGHPFDREALKSLYDDEEVIEWRKAMDKMAMLPLKR